MSTDASTDYSPRGRHGHGPPWPGTSLSGDRPLVDSLPGITQARRAADEGMDQLLSSLSELFKRLEPHALRPNDGPEDGDTMPAEADETGSGMAVQWRIMAERIGRGNRLVGELLDRLDV